MIRRKTFYIFLALLIGWIGQSPAGEVTKVGTTAAPFLTIGVGARAIGMGGAYVSVANDATAMFWNVSGLAQLTGPEIIFNHSEWLEQINFDYAGVVAPMGSFGTVGVSFTSLSMGEFEQTTEDNPEGTGIRFSAGSFAVGVSYARKLTDRFMIGFTGKFVREYIWNSSAVGGALDVGTLFVTPFQGIRLGMSISNFGTKMQITGDDLLTQIDPDPLISGNNDRINAYLQTDQFDMPLLFRVGLSMDVINTEENLLTLSVDALHPNDNAESMNIGGEYMFQDLFALRAGYRSLFLEDSEEGFTAGVGLKAKVSGFSVLIDYAYEDFGRLNNIQKFTLRMAF
ncbi:MAG: hypothetical protein D6748_09110 [Calditrichaeota bacterium]|nr:MAG: hypothetical protein D6748_09110 [Calditrichota bacterium]